jgi:hypothetical protein
VSQVEPRIQVEPKQALEIGELGLVDLRPHRVAADEVDHGLQVVDRRDRLSRLRWLEEVRPDEADLAELRLDPLALRVHDPSRRDCIARGREAPQNGPAQSPRPAGNQYAHVRPACRGATP